MSLYLSLHTHVLHLHSCYPLILYILIALPVPVTQLLPDGNPALCSCDEGST